jgi:flagellar protein FliL
MSDAAVAEEAPVEASPKKGKTKLFIIAGAAVALLAAAGGGAWFFMHGSAAEKDKKADSAKHAKAEPVKKGPALYVAMDPPFVVNFQAQSAVRFLQVTVQIMTRDSATQALLKENDPILRNDLLNLMGNLEYEKISTTEGKEDLRASALQAVRKIVNQEGGKGELVEAVYFTSFVMQ